MPVLGQLCRILTGQAYESREETSYVQVQLPQIENTGDSSLEQRVNLEISAVLSREVDESKERARQYYQAYLDTGGDPDTFQPIQIQVDYQVKSVTDQWASFVVTKTESLASAYFRQYFYNLDLETGQSLTLRDVLGLSLIHISPGFFMPKSGKLAIITPQKTKKSSYTSLEKTKGGSGVGRARCV